MSVNEKGEHGGEAECLRHVPFISFTDKLAAKPGEVLDQRSVAPTILALLGISRPETMESQPLF
ncbi:MAG: hypothetical protein AAGF82_05675 [Pseudomonadota bacterium]